MLPYRIDMFLIVTTAVLDWLSPRVRGRMRGGLGGFTTASGPTPLPPSMRRKARKARRLELRRARLRGDLPAPCWATMKPVKWSRVRSSGARPPAQAQAARCCKSERQLEKVFEDR